MARKKTRRSQKKGPSKPNGPKTPPQLPLDIIYNIGLQLIQDPKQRLETLHGPVWLPQDNNKDLRALTYASRATRDLLEPLLYRHVALTKPQQVCSFFVTLVAAPRLRQHVQHFGCFARLNGPQVRKGALPECKKFWQKHHGSQRMSILTAIAGLGFPSLVWAASVWERKKGRFVFNADFRHDAVLELMFACTLFLLTNVQTFVWKDLDGKPIAPLLTYLFDVGVTADLPLMPKLKVLDTWKETLDEQGRAQFFPFRTHIWENLHTLYLNAFDLDNEFTDLAVKGDFKKDLPIKKLYVHCATGSQHLYHPGMYRTGQTVSSDSGLDAVDPDKDKDKFQAFRNLELLEVNFTWFELRAHDGSRALKALLHAVGAPERLNLLGHPLPMKALSTGVVHSRLKYLKVTEVIRNAPSSVQSKDSLIAKLHELWETKDWKRLVPNLCEIDWDHYKFRRTDLEGDDKAVWTLEDEEEWEDEDDEDDDDMYPSIDGLDDDDDIFGYGYDQFNPSLDGLDEEDGLEFGGNPLTMLEALYDGENLEELISHLVMHFPPPGAE